MGMYAKLMSRITESSLMEEAIVVRYTFMLLLAVADPKGYAIGTDVALARRLNMSVEDFQAAIAELMKPDPDSNSKEQEGRRVIESDAERGYFVVNYGKYRDTRNEEERREWMREYMKKYRERKASEESVKPRKPRKPELANAEGEATVEGPAEENVSPPTPAAAPLVKGGIREGKQSDRVPTTPQSKRFAAIVHRKETTPWQKSEIEAYQKLGTVPEEDLNDLEQYYSGNWPPARDKNILRHDLLALLNHFAGEVDRAHAFKLQGRGRAIRENIIPNIIRSEP